MGSLHDQQRRGLARWRAECAGEIEPPAELRHVRRLYGWNTQQIAAAFEALGDVSVHEVGGEYLIGDRELTALPATKLMREKLIRLDRQGWALTRKGRELLDLLLTYGAREHRWSRSSSFSP